MKLIFFIRDCNLTVSSESDDLPIRRVKKF